MAVSTRVAHKAVCSSRAPMQSAAGVRVARHRCIALGSQHSSHIADVARSHSAQHALAGSIY